MVGAVLGLVSIFGNMPMVVLAVASAIAGAFSVVGGLMLVFGALNSSDFTRSTFVDAIQNSWLWTLLVVALAVVGIVAQTRARVATGRTVRETWYAEAR